MSTPTIKKTKKGRLDKLSNRAKRKSGKNPSMFFGKLKTGEDGLTYQKAARNEWS